MFLNTTSQLNGPSGLASWYNDENMNQTAQYRRCMNYSCYFVKPEYGPFSQRELTDRNHCAWEKVWGFFGHFPTFSNFPLVKNKTYV